MLKTRGRYLEPLFEASLTERVDPRSKTRRSRTSSCALLAAMRTAKMAAAWTASVWSPLSPFDRNKEIQCQNEIKIKLRR